MWICDAVLRRSAVQHSHIHRANGMSFCAKRRLLRKETFVAQSRFAGNIVAGNIVAGNIVAGTVVIDRRRDWTFVARHVFG